MISPVIKSEKIPRLELCVGVLLTFGISLVIALIIFSKNIEMNESIVQKVNITGDLRYTSKKQLTDALGPLVEFNILLTASISKSILLLFNNIFSATKFS